VSAEGVVMTFYRGLGLAYANPALTIEGTAAVAGLFYNGADDLCPTCKGDELTKVFRGTGVKVLDFFGGKISRYANALNIDEQAEKGFKGSISAFHSFLKNNKLLESVDAIMADNPQDFFLKEAGDVLKSGGTLTVRGNERNKFFQPIYEGTAEGLNQFKVISRTPNVAKEGMKRTDGSDIQGVVNEIVLRKN
jgi:hypothetical protein